MQFAERSRKVTSQVLAMLQADDGSKRFDGWQYDVEADIARSVHTCELRLR